MKEKVLDKLKKMIDHAASAEKIGSRAEAEAFGAKIQAMLDEHNLSMDEVELHAAKSSPIGPEHLSFVDDRTLEDWFRFLFGCIASINGCIIVGDLQHIFIVGREQDRKVTIGFCKYFYDLCRKLEQEFRDSHKPKPAVTPAVVYQGGLFGGTVMISSATVQYQSSFYTEAGIDARTESYMHGVCVAICERLEAAYHRSMDDQEETAALVFLKNRTNDTLDWIKTQNPNIESRSSPPQLSDRESFERGLRDGDRSALTDKVLG